MIEVESIGLKNSSKRPIVIAGPCSAESEEQVIETAMELSDNGCDIFRAGIWKPRTKPGCFEGHGEKALLWLKNVKDKTGLPIATEVASSEHVELCLKYGIDILWIGARTTTNPFTVQSIADSLQGVDIPVLVKNPVNPDLELWIGALERLNRSGIKKLGAIHRGFSSYGQKLFRNSPMWQIPIELHRRIPEMPIICDPSHLGGKRDFIATLCQQAMDLGFDGLMVECHNNPENALSDADQQITPNCLKKILTNLIIRSENIPNNGLSEMRKEIDIIDDQIMELLAKRMNISREIGEYKKAHNLTVRQSKRYGEILAKRCLQGKLSGISPEFINKIFESIHEESIRQQFDTIN